MISYQFKCKDLGFNSCDFQITGNSESEIKRKFFFHTALEHEKEFDLLCSEQKVELHLKLKKMMDGQSRF